MGGRGQTDMYVDADADTDGRTRMDGRTDTNTN